MLLDADTSFEVRSQLARLVKDLPPAAAPADEPKPQAADIGPLLDRLNSDRSSQREGAQRRLEAMLPHLDLVAPLLAELKRRLDDPAASRQARRVMESVLDKAREAWVDADPASVPLPQVSNAQMNRWLDELTASEPQAAAGRALHATAHRELIDLLVRDDTRERLLELLEPRMAELTDADAAARLQDVADFARPAMAAEVWGHQKEDPETGQSADWQHRQHIWVQNMIVGVPQLVEAAARPTHFDRIDDRTAHCVSGNSLTPGDYPVGIAIPNPNPALEVMYYLVNLPTPRQRLAYAYHLKRDEGQRLAEISQKTLDDFLVNRRPLDELRVMMLRQLDPHVVSRFVGPYFQNVPDAPLQTAAGDAAPGHLTIHAAICATLCSIGTREAVPALEKLARSGRLGKPNYDNNVHVSWVAALAIANSDPWPGVDEWLATLIDETEPLIINIDPVPDLGSSAAGLLLDAARRLAPRVRSGADRGSDRVGPLRRLPLHLRHGPQGRPRMVARPAGPSSQASGTVARQSIGFRLREGEAPAEPAIRLELQSSLVLRLSRSFALPVLVRLRLPRGATRKALLTS